MAHELSLVDGGWLNDTLIQTMGEGGIHYPTQYNRHLSAEKSSHTQPSSHPQGPGPTALEGVPPRLELRVGNTPTQIY